VTVGDYGTQASQIRAGSENVPADAGCRLRFLALQKFRAYLVSSSAAQSAFNDSEVLLQRSDGFRDQRADISSTARVKLGTW